MDKIIIEEIYAPKDGSDNDNWMGGLELDETRIRDHLGGENSSVFVAIQQTGDYLFRVRKIIKELELSATTNKTEDELDDAVADEVNEWMSCFARSPAMRFYKPVIAIHSFVVDCFMKRQKKPSQYNELPWSDSQYNAVVTYSLFCQIHLMRDQHNREKKEQMISEIIRSMTACLEARPNDATMHVCFGNFLFFNDYSQDAKEYLEKALEIDEDLCFGSHYTLANMIINKVPEVDTINRLGPMEQLQAITFTKLCQQHLRKYLALAPIGHWHVHRACMLLIRENATSSVRGGRETVKSIEERNPGFCAENHDLFERGVQAMELYNNSYGRETKDFKRLYKSAATLIVQIQKFNLLPGRSVPDCKFYCSNPNCTNDDFGCVVVDKDNNKTTRERSKPLQLCNGCGSVRYCSRHCQVSHWKMKENGHKEECKRLGKERVEKQKMPKPRPPIDTGPTIGDDSN